MRPMPAVFLSRVTKTYPEIFAPEVERFWSEVPDAKIFEPIHNALSAVASASPYLSGLLLEHFDFARDILRREPEAVLEELVAHFLDAAHSDNEQALRASLRNIKARSALLVALCDVLGVWSVRDTTDALTRVADAALQAAINFLLLQHHRAGHMQLADLDKPGFSCGYVALAMGKHGAFELNYSSDIDLIILYDPNAPITTNADASTFFVRLTRSLVSILQDVTEHGYVHRVDLRLRPDPRATQVAISIEAAATYYENLGQNWERAAMIKARPAAGDIALGEEFLDRLIPYIWRRYLDYAAIADVQSLKRQIHATKGHGEIAILGHNLKLGRGGIREIEFFVQTQQLIAGGRNKALRGRSTVAMLAALAKAGWITPLAASELTEAYGFLRMLEHRIQMTADQQDHCVPKTEIAFESFALFAGFPSAATLHDQLLSTLNTVQRHYEALFADADELAIESGNLVFTGGEDDPETLETLSRLGFKDAAEIAATIRGWHFGRYNATRTKRSRELLTELMPKLLTALAATGDPDQAFLAFDRFIQGLPAGVQLFSMIKANAHLLELLAKILGSAPRLAQQLSRQPRTLEVVLERGFFGPLPAKEELAASLDAMIPDDTPLEEAMDRARIFGREQLFRVGVRTLSETVTASEAGLGYANVADALLQKLHRLVATDLERRHGRIAGGSSAIIAMGKLGGQEMTAASDLDLIIVYDHGASENSNGDRPISVQQYYARFTQRLISAITAPTAEGILYEVDMRLRPSGSQGPVAVSLASFKSYQKDSAWTWEKMAMTRARIISRIGGIEQGISAVISEALTTPRDQVATLKDICKMRALMLKEHRSTSLWDIKRKPGGLVDIEFIAQALQLIHAPSDRSMLHTNTGAALNAAKDARLLSQEDAKILIDGWELYSRLTQLLRLCVEGAYEPKTAASGLNQLVAGAAAMPDIGSTEAMLADTAAGITHCFRKIVGNPYT
jgi:[glutamine synthetase] adenylyltransferase / [glutamine synthetase]-adenylyl-L-tyrosine phosphorylase